MLLFILWLLSIHLVMATGRHGKFISSSSSQGDAPSNSGTSFGRLRRIHTSRNSLHESSSPMTPSFWNKVRGGSSDSLASLNGPALSLLVGEDREVTPVRETSVNGLTSIVEVASHKPDEDDLFEMEIDEEPTPATTVLDLALTSDHTADTLNVFSELKQQLLVVLRHLRRKDFRRVAQALNSIARLQTPQIVLDNALAELGGPWEHMLLFKQMLNSFLIYSNALKAITATSAYMDMQLWHIHLHAPSLTVYVASIAAARKLMDDLKYIRKHHLIRFTERRTFQERLPPHMNDAILQGDGQAPEEIKEQLSLLEHLGSAASTIDEVAEHHVVGTYDLSIDMFNGMNGVMTVLQKVSAPVSRVLDNQRVKVALSSVALVLELVRAVAKPALMVKEFTVDFTITVKALDFLEELKKIDLADE